MGAGRGSCLNRTIASILGIAIIATIVAVCAVYIPKNHYRHHDHDQALGDPSSHDSPSSSSSDDNDKPALDPASKDSPNDIPAHPEEVGIDNGMPKVTNKEAFKNGGAAIHPTKTGGNEDAKDEYHLYKGEWTEFPGSEDWVSFDEMWDSNLPSVKTACKDHGWGDDNSKDENEMIKSQIDYISKASLIDHRFILAIILQESKGCLRVTSTDSLHGVHNPGLMQSHNGSSYTTSDDADEREKSIRQMIQDGAQGTKQGDGLVQTLNKFGNVFSAARGYNSGDVGKSGDLGDAIGSTACYVSDVANRLMGWIAVESTCSEEALGVVQSAGNAWQAGTAWQAGSDDDWAAPAASDDSWSAPADGSASADDGQWSASGGDTSSTTTTTGTTSTGANSDGTYSGGHWDTNGNYVQGGSTRRKRGVVFRS
ncbi:uncharacterized protein RCC_01149 [Ramularia collo-cygni]|uniref:Transglycosylase SLT domain-containing protein n=1 Tax=Ramularia collo-cygni TaxID=112498 RepID=A0A2D3UQ77_9PEZI|nr:uncharacterized protein RCC_01149 [Ramularia collo-cygni]CZT15285.1 uncharacterized protein RCC_01149 [Ramularia collo-cygni]